MKYRIILFVHALLICLLQLIPNTIISATWAGGPDKIIYNRYSFFLGYTDMGNGRLLVSSHIISFTADPLLCSYYAYTRQPMEQDRDLCLICAANPFDVDSDTRYGR